MPIFLLCFWSTLLIAAPAADIQEAKKSITALIRPLMPGLNRAGPPKELKDFRIDGCQKHQIDWMNVLLMRSEAKLTYKFAPGCDIDGTISPRVFQSFPANLKLKNLNAYNKIETDNKITASFESKPLMNLEMRSGALSGKKGTVKFEADYSVKLNPADTKKLVEKNLGGELRITEIYGEKVSIKEKIMLE